MVQIETLPNGVRIVTEPMDTVRSAALGIWVGGGSREEAPSESGAAHFIEHMLFKGTQRRSAQDIARETDAIGGQMNAFTTKECTCFYGRVLDSHLPQALDILFDMVYHSSFAQEAVETERGVILEEIDMYEDTPDDLCAEKLFGAVFQGSALARPILGSAETLAPMTGPTTGGTTRWWPCRGAFPRKFWTSFAGGLPPCPPGRLSLWCRRCIPLRSWSRPSPLNRIT